MLMVNQLVGFGSGESAGPGWDSLKKHADVTLSNSNFTGTASAGWRNVLSVTGVNAGKRYAEVMANSVASQIVIGLATASAPLNSQLAQADSNSWAYREIGIASQNSGSPMTGTYSSYTSNDIINLAYDAATGKIWFGKNGTFVGSPSAGTSAGATITALTLLYVASGYGGSGSSSTINLGTSVFSYSPPSGFSSWMTA